MAEDLGFVAAHNVLVPQARAQIPARLLETCAVHTCWSTMTTYNHRNS